MRTRHAISGRRDACRLVACGIAALALGLLLSATLLLPVSGCRGHDALAEHAAKWDRTVNLPLAPHGEELTNASLPPKSLFVDISMRDEAGAVRPKPAITFEGESLSSEGGSGVIQKAVRRQTGGTSAWKKGFNGFVRADAGCSHSVVNDAIDGFNSAGIWDVSIVARADAESNKPTTFKILRLCPCPLPEEDAHIGYDVPFDEEDDEDDELLLLGYRLTFWVGSRSDGSTDGAFFYCKKVVSLDELDAIVAKLAADPKTAGKTVAIRCAINSPHKALVDVLDTLGKYKFRRVYVITM